MMASAVSAIALPPSSRAWSAFFALDAQTLVGLFALKARLLVFWRHRCREVYTSPLIALASK
jgi:hypothetical protein